MFAVNIDYDWDLRKTSKRCSPPLRCVCGRRLCYQYELESVKQPSRHVCLGSTHFAEHLGIPVAVAQEVRNNVNQIQSLMDEVLIRYRAGERFPAHFIGRVDAGVLLLEDEPFRKRVLAYRRVDLPLTAVDKGRLRRLIENTSDEQLAIAKTQQAEHERARATKLEAERKRKAQLRRLQVRTRQQNQIDLEKANQLRHEANVARRQRMWQEMMEKKRAQFADKTPEEIAALKRQHEVKVKIKKEQQRQHRLAVEAEEKSAEQEELLRAFLAAKRAEKRAAVHQNDKPKKIRQKATRPSKPKGTTKTQHSTSNQKKVVERPLMNRQLYDQLKKWQDMNH